MNNLCVAYTQRDICSYIYCIVTMYFVFICSYDQVELDCMIGIKLFCFVDLFHSVLVFCYQVQELTLV